MANGLHNSKEWVDLCHRIEREVNQFIKTHDPELPECSAAFATKRARVWRAMKEASREQKDLSWQEARDCHRQERKEQSQ